MIKTGSDSVLGPNLNQHLEIASNEAAARTEYHDALKLLVNRCSQLPYTQIKKRGWSAFQEQIDDARWLLDGKPEDDAA
jgi:hypothetical protein